MNSYCTLLMALAVGFAPVAYPADFVFTSFVEDDTPYLFDPLSKRWDTGDSLIAPIQIEGTIGGFTGKKNALIFPEISAFGRTIIPEVRDDTRTGLRLTSDIDLFAGVQLYAGVSSGGYAAPVATQLTPTLSTPGVMRAGRFYSLTGSTALGSNTGYTLSLPTLEAGLDVVAGGTANFTLEAALWPVLDYSKVTTRNDLGRQVANVFNLEMDLNAPNITDYIPKLEVPGIPDVLLAPDDNDLYRTKLPPNDPRNPLTILKNFGELAIVDPIGSRVTETPVVDAKSVSNSFSGELFRTGIDIDGILTFLATGVSYSGLEVPVQIPAFNFGTAYYDILDVKYGLELGYRETSTVDTNLEAMLEFFAAGTSDPIDVLIRQGEDVVIGNSVAVADWTQLPELALLGARDVDVKLQFTALTRDLTRSLDLTLGDYMEVKAWQLGFDASGVLNAAGVPDLQLGPLVHEKFELAGEFASLNVFTDTVGSLRDVFDATTWAPTLFRLSAAPTLDAYLIETDITVPGLLPGTEFTVRGYGNLGVAGNLRKLGSTDAPSSVADSVIIVGTATDAVASRNDLSPLAYTDPGQQRTVRATGTSSGFPFARDITGVSDPFSFTTVSGLVVPEGSTYTLNADSARRFKLLTLENDGLIGGNGFLGFHALEADGSLVISGQGTVRFDSAAELVGGTVSHGAGHTIEFNGVTPWRSNFNARVGRPLLATEPPTVNTSNPAYYELERNHGQRITTRSLVARQQFNNAGHLLVDNSTLVTDIGTLRNTRTGVVTARNGASLRIDGTQTGRTVIENAGLIEAFGDAEITFDTNRITGGSEAPGVFRLASGGDMRFEGSTDLSLLQQLDFEVGNDSLLDFTRPLATFDDTTARLLIEAGGAVRLNGMRSDTGRVVVENDGLLDVVSGNVSFTGGGGLSPVFSRITPIDLHNRGTVRVRQGAQLVFDVDVVNYANGGATLSEGTWELLGANVVTSNRIDPGLDNASYAVMQMNVSDVFGKAADFADLVFEQEFDPDTGELLLSNSISELDTALVNNAANVTLSGAAFFGYFNTVRTNSGTLNLRNQHRFTTVSSYENLGGTTNVEAGAGLIVNGGLFVHGGEVRFSGNSQLTVHGTSVDVGGVMERRDIEVVGGTLVVDAGTLELGGLVGRGRTDGLLLNAEKSWIAREQVTVNDDGSETVTPGHIELGLRTTNGVAGVIRNNAGVTLDGAAASFGGFEETLQYQHGELSLRNGKIYESPNNYFRNAGTMSLVNAQFHLLGPSNVFLNDGELSIDDGSYLRAYFVDLNAGSLALDGILDAEIVEIATTGAVTGTGTLKATLVQLASGQAFTLSGGTLISDVLRGALDIDAGLFDIFVGTGHASVFGDLSQSAAGRLKFDWGSTAVDQLTVFGAATLGGGVELNFLDGFVPEIGASLEVLTADALFGSFDDAQLVYDRSLGRSFAFRYFDNSVFIDVRPAPIPLPAAVWALLSGCGVLALRHRRPN